MTLRGERVGVLDVGGGSTEYAVGDSLRPDRRRFVRNRRGAFDRSGAVARGSRRLSQRRGRSLERAKSREKRSSHSREYAAVERLAFVGGSATTTAAIVKGRRTPIACRIHSRVADLQRTLERLLAMKLEDRKRVAGMKPQRADILPAGIIVLDTALETLGHEQGLATTADLLLGILLQERDAAGGPSQAMRAGSERRGFRP